MVLKNEVVITSAVRTPIGSLIGIFNNISAISLGKTAVIEALKRSQIVPEMVDEVIIGNVLNAGLGQNIARQVAINAGIPESVPAFTVGMVCGSGMKAIQLACQSIENGNADVVVAGGTENMSQSPFILKNHRTGQKIGNTEFVDTLINDGLTDAFTGYHMGITAENISNRYNISREDQDLFAVNSQKKAGIASQGNIFCDEIVPVIENTKAGITEIKEDEHIRENTTIDKLSKLRPAFKEYGTVTAGNSSGINDGSSVVVLMSKAKAYELGIPILGTIVSYANAGVSPKLMGTGSIPATIKALNQVKWQSSDLELVEINEAFAAQAICVIKELRIGFDITNVNGGAIALGHPIGSSGARILVTLVHEMNRRKSKKGLASLCIGGGQGSAILVERK